MILLAAWASLGAAESTWVGLGPWGGPATLVRVDPQRLESVLAASRNGSLFWSDDGAMHWRRLRFPLISGASIEAALIHPARAGEHRHPLLFAGVAGETAYYSGLYRSDDGGYNWSEVPEIKGQAVFSLVMSAKDPDILVCGTRTAVWLSRDRGATWNRISPLGGKGPSPVVSLAINPDNADEIYAGTTHLPWKTSDGGATWSVIHDGMLDDSDVFSIHVDPAAPERVYASACSGIYSSANSGGLWKRAQGIPGTDRRTHVVTQDPEIGNIVFAGTTAGLYKSIDSGTTWQKLNGHAVRSLAFGSGNGRVVYLATVDRGLLKSTDAARTFREVNEGFAGRHVSHVVQLRSGRIVAVASVDGGAGGVFRSDDGGVTWIHDLPALQKIGSVNHLTAYDGSVIATTAKGLWKMDRDNWVALATPGKSAPLAVEAHSHLWAGGTGGLWRSMNGGGTWTPIRVATDRTPVYEIATHGKSVFVRTRSGLWLSADAGSRWTAAVPPPLGAGQVSGWAIHAKDPRSLFAATAGGLMRSRDLGRTWKRVEHGLPTGFVGSITFDSRPVPTAYTVQLGRIYRSLDGGETWKALDADAGELDGLHVRHLYVAPGDTGKLFAITGGQGLFARKFLSYH